MIKNTVRIDTVQKRLEAEGFTYYRQGDNIVCSSLSSLDNGVAYIRQLHPSITTVYQAVAIFSGRVLGIQEKLADKYQPERIV